MSVEDTDSGFQSDDSTCEAEERLSDASDEPIELQLSHLLYNLMNFQDIYANNAVIDTEYEESEAWQSFDVDSLNSELAVLQDGYLDDVFSTNSPPSSWDMSHRDVSSPDSEDSALSFFHDFLELFEEGIPFPSGLSNASGDAGGQPTDADDPSQHGSS